MSVFLLFIGTMIAGFGMGGFLLPNKLSSGGFTGIGTIFYYLYGWDVGRIIIVLNIPFFIWSFKRLGKSFFFKSILGTFLLSFFIDLFEKVPTITTDILLASICGGVLIGIGTALVFKSRSSTGGSDLIVYILKSYTNKISMSKLLSGIDIFVVLLNVIFFRNIEIGLYSAITIFLVGRMVDIIFEGTNFSKLLFIITDEGKEVLKMINFELDLGATEIYGIGGYTEKSKQIILTAISRRDLPNLREKLSLIDEHAFLIVTNAREVYGLGFKSF